MKTPPVSASKQSESAAGKPGELVADMVKSGAPEGEATVWLMNTPMVIVILSVICLIAGLAYGWLVWNRSRRYDFPVIELPQRLGASYAAGVGAVIAFHSKLGSPSRQKRQLPDYLTPV